jgi:hypothetical protein
VVVDVDAPSSCSVPRVGDAGLQKRRFCYLSTGFIAAAGLVVLLIIAVAVAVPLVVLRVAGGQPARALVCTRWQAPTAYATTVR